MAKKILAFISGLNASGVDLPPGIRLQNPYSEDPQVMDIARKFYQKFYNDNLPRLLILGINPGRFGGGTTGIPFTDPKRLLSACGIAYEGKITHEPSSVFIYDMIHAYGGPEAFYKKYYINSLCPLTVTIQNKNGKEINHNYYDSPTLAKCLENFMVDNILNQIKLGVRPGVCFCFGTGKNAAFLNKLNCKHHFFDKIVALEHPRFIVQYKSKQKNSYIDKYLQAFQEAEQT